MPPFHISKTHLYKLTIVMVNIPAIKPINTMTIPGIYLSSTRSLRKTTLDNAFLNIFLATHFK